MALVDEVSTEDQGLAHFAFCPTQACLEKYCTVLVVPLYRFARMPVHSEYHSGTNTWQVRTMLAASPAPKG
jgi:hypothetical protein